MHSSVPFHEIRVLRGHRNIHINVLFLRSARVLAFFVVLSFLVFSLSHREKPNF